MSKIIEIPHRLAPLWDYLKRTPTSAADLEDMQYLIGRKNAAGQTRREWAPSIATAIMYYTDSQPSDKLLAMAMFSALYGPNRAYKTLAALPTVPGVNKRADRDPPDADGLFRVRLVAFGREHPEFGRLVDEFLGMFSPGVHRRVRRRRH